MHMANEILSLPVAGIFAIISAGALAVASSRAKKDFPDKKIPLMGVMGAFIFAAQMVNFPVLMGSSGHLVGGVLLSILLGPHIAAITMTGILIIQCLVFQDGGILALGCNIFNMAFVSTYTGYFIFKAIAGKKEITRTRLFLSSLGGAFLGVFFSALSVPFQVGISQISDIPISSFFLLMGGAHILIGLIEGLITGIVVLAIGSAQPEFLHLKINWKSKVKPGYVIATVALLTLVTAGGLSLVASELPDGLEWSLSRWNPSQEKQNLSSPTAEKISNLQKSTALFPDYNSPSGGKEKYWTSIAGLAGTALAALFALGMAFLGKKKKKNIPTSSTNT